MDRRKFFKCLVGSSALSIYALNQLNAAVYQSIASLNQKFIKDNSPDGVYWDSIAKHYIFQDDLIMMNNGTVGPMPEPVFNTLMKCFKSRISERRIEKNPQSESSYPSRSLFKRGTHSFFNRRCRS